MYMGICKHDAVPVRSGDVEAGEESCRIITYMVTIGDICTFSIASLQVYTFIFSHVRE